MNTTNDFGVATMSGALRKVGMRRPGAILTADSDTWHYAKPIDAGALQQQYDAFAELVAASGAEIHWLPDADDDGLADSVFTYDASFVVGAGAVILRPGKDLRQAEAALHADFYESIGMPILGTIDAPGTIEGGDCFFLDPSTIAVGRGVRTNQAGIDQLATIVEPSGVTVEAYDLPYLHGPDACLHLMSVISPLDHDLALVHAPLVPYALYERMESLGYTLLHAPEHEFEASLGLNLNVLATGPRQLIAIEGFPGTVELMRSAGCTVEVFTADELCIPCEGGPTCLTRPLLRD
jgi:dimethylargininase